MDVFEKMFTEFQTSAYRVEALPTYYIEGGEWEEFQEYEKGIPIRGFANQDWLDDLVRWKESGREVIRVRIMPPILTPYLQYELEWCYPRNWLGGESIKVAKQELYNQLVKPEVFCDYWIFDKKYVLKMEYSEDGKYLGEKLISKPNLVKEYLDLFIDLNRKSVQYTDFMKIWRQKRIIVKL